jgi:hypothetical protein
MGAVPFVDGQGDDGSARKGLQWRGDGRERG